MPNMTFSLMIANLIIVISLCILFPTVTQSSEVGKEASHPKPRSDAGKSLCYAQCDSRFPSSKMDPWLACHRGCRLLALLGQVANGKAQRSVKRSCLAACTEAYNTTLLENACHFGCGQQVAAKKKKQKQAVDRRIRNDSKAETSTAPAVVLKPNVRYFWSKSIVDQQDLDSSSEERPNMISGLMLDSPRDRPTDPFVAISEILNLPQSVRISKSSVTYIGSSSLSSPAIPDHKVLIKPPIGVIAPTLFKEPTPEPPSRAQNSGDDPSPRLDIEIMAGSRVIDYHSSGDEKAANITLVSWKQDGTLWRMDIMLCFIGLSFFIVFVTLFRAITSEKNYQPVTTSDGKGDDAMHCQNDEDGADSEQEFLLEMGPPTYEQSQQELHVKMSRPMHVSLDISTTNNLSC